MMDCRRVRQLLPLWVGQDLPDAISTADVAIHLTRCPDCEQHRKSLQNSLEILQGSSSETLAVESGRPSVWPPLVSRISEWEISRRRERFNGWIPASVMALAVLLMIAVSIPSIQYEFFGDGANDLNRNYVLFGSEPQFDSIRPSDKAKPPERSFYHSVGYPSRKLDPW